MDYIFINEYDKNKKITSTDVIASLIFIVFIALILYLIAKCIVCMSRPPQTNILSYRKSGDDLSLIESKHFKRYSSV